MSSAWFPPSPTLWESTSEMRFAPERIGTIVDWRGSERWSGTDIDRHAAALCTRLRDLGAGPGKRVVLWHGGSGRFFADLFGIWQTGACAVCLNPSTTLEELQRILDFVDALAVIDVGPRRLGDELTATPIDSLMIDQTEAIGRPGTGNLDDDALILFTSGTTGTPKGVVHTFRSLLARIALNQANIPAAERARALNVLPTHFGHGLIGNCLTPLLDGQTVVLAPAANLDVATRLGSLIDEHGITFMSSVPTLWKRILGTSAAPESGSLARVHVGSAPLSTTLWEGISAWAGTRNVVNMYGITETANWIAGAALTDSGATDGAVGRMWGGAAAVRSDDGEIHAVGDGELVVQAPSLMKGYFRLPEQTADVLADGWFRTGDIGHIDAAGSIRLTGRQKYEINRGGLKVHPEDIDLLLERHPTVGEACAFAIPDEIEGEAVGVAVTPVAGVEVDTRALRRWCAERLAREKVPTRWFVVTEIPKTDRGKINRDVVAAHCLQETA
jgi:acyl-CoA synthetase (AMP-forming)/AMP-acid ligase II